MRKLIAIIIFFTTTTNLFAIEGWIAYYTSINTSFRDIEFVNSNTGWAVGTGGIIVKTTTGGLSWVQQNSGTSTDLLSVSFINENTGWAAGGSRNLFALNFYEVIGTTNGGLTWDSLHYSGVDQSYINMVYLKNPNLGFNLGEGGNGGGTQGFLFKSTTFGNTWTSGLTQTYNYFDIVFKDNNTGWLLTKYADDTDHDTAAVMRTSNGGLTWSRIFFRNKLNLYSIHYLGNDDILVYGQSFMTGLQGRFTMKSTDGGQSWDSIYGPSGGNYWEADFTDFNKGWAVGTSGIFRTTNGGASFTQQMGSGNINSIIMIDSLKGWATADNGIILRTITGGVTGISPIGTGIPGSFSLYQNYPNPFNPATKIKFDIPKSGNVKLAVYDIAGKEITELVNQNLSPGSYITSWNAEGRASGVYFYSLEAEGYKENRKMLLIK